MRKRVADLGRHLGGPLLTEDDAPLRGHIASCGRQAVGAVVTVHHVASGNAELSERLSQRVDLLVLIKSFADELTTSFGLGRIARGAEDRRGGRGLHARQTAWLQSLGPPPPVKYLTRSEE